MDTSNITEKKLTDKEELFCKSYIKYLNKTKAAKQAGYSAKTAGVLGYEIFKKPYIQHRISQLREEMQKELGIDEHSVLSELAALGYWSIKDFIEDNNIIKDLSKMPKKKLKPVSGIKVKEIITTIGDVSTKEITTELKMVDKRAALIDLGRHLGIFEKDNDQKSLKIKVTRKSG